VGILESQAFHYVDLARRVVGVGSVGTRCGVMLMSGRDDQDPLFLQIKEAQASVLDRFDRAVAEFAAAYADLNASDHVNLVNAVTEGRVSALRR
jgi:uncharacterized protein (DUF2252 family)